ncbi:MAG: HD domain-containing protein [Bdellovibrionales bacterium]|nr:HD domain-containing protein [Bdellovibrionales bacterium]
MPSADAQIQEVEGLERIGLAVSVPSLADSIVEIVQKSGVKAEEYPAEGEDAGYVRIRTTLLMRMSPLPVGVYIRLSPTKYLKIFAPEDVFDAQDLQKYQDKKNIQYFFVPKENAGVFVGRLNEQLKQLLAMENISLSESQQQMEESVDAMQNLINSLGVTDEVREVVQNNVDVTMKAMGEFPELGGILKNLHANQTSYLASHSLMLAHVACALAVGVDWYSEATFQKLSMAAFLHDTALQNNDLCRVKDLQELEKKYKGQFTAKQVAEYKAHPEKAALMIAQFKEVGAEVDKIILQHHEHPYGTGFPGALNASYISPLASLFIVAHDLVDHLFDRNGVPNIEEFLLENEKKYAQGNFKKVAKAIMQMVF